MSFSLKHTSLTFSPEIIYSVSDNPYLCSFWHMLTQAFLTLGIDYTAAISSKPPRNSKTQLRALTQLHFSKNQIIINKNSKMHQFLKSSMNFDKCIHSLNDCHNQNTPFLSCKKVKAVERYVDIENLSPTAFC